METISGPQHESSLLNFKEKIAFFSVNFGNIPIMTMMYTYLLLFYTDVVGLDPVAIGTLFLIARVMDGISDPIMGYVIDHLPRLKMGRFRGYLLIGVIVCSLNFLLVWLGPSLVTSGKLVIAYVSYLLIGWTFDLMDIPLNSMIPVMSDKDKDRNTLSIIKGVGYMVGAIVIVTGALPLINAFPTKREGFHVVVIGVAVIVVALSVFGTLGIKERIFPVRGERYKVKNIKEIFGARPVLILFLENFAWQTGYGVNSGTQVFFFLYVVKRPDLFPLVGASYLLGILVSVVLAPGLIKRFGKKTCLAYALMISLTGSIIMFSIPSNLPIMFVIVAMLASPGIGMNSAIYYGIQADNTDYIEWKWGYRADAAVASLNSFITKAAQGIGSAIGAYLLAFYHYYPNAETQTTETIRGLYNINFAIPAVFMLIALLVWSLGYPLTKKVTAQMMSELAERRQESAT